MQRVVTIRTAIAGEFKDNFDEKTGKLTGLTPSQVGKLLGLPEVQRMGVGRFVQEMMLGSDANLTFVLSKAAREQLAWSLGEKTRDILNSKPQQLVAEAQAAFVKLNDKFPDPALFLAFADGQKGIIRTTGPDGKPEELWIKMPPNSHEALLALRGETFEPATGTASAAVPGGKATLGFPEVQVLKLEGDRVKTTIPGPASAAGLAGLGTTEWSRTFDLSSPHDKAAYEKLISQPFQDRVTVYVGQNPFVSLKEAISYLLGR